MGIVVKQSVHNAIITYIGIGLGFVLTVLLYPHILNPDQYGLTRVLISASFISAQFAHLGVRNSIIKFFPLFSDKNRSHHGLLFWTFLIPLFGFILFGILFWLFRDTIINYYTAESPLFTEYYLWILPITLFVLYFEVLNSYLRSLKDSTTGSMVNEVLQRIFIILFLALYFFEWIGFFQFILLFAISYGVQPILLAIQIYRLDAFSLKPNFSLLKKPLLKQISSYGLYSLLGGLTTVLVWNVDIIMLGSMAGLADTAVYAIAFYIASVVTVPQRSIEKIATPLVSDFIQKEDWKSLGDIYRKTSLNQLIAGLLIFGLIWINIDLIFSLLPVEYHAGKWVVLIVAAGKMIDLATGVNSSILINSKYYRVAFYANLLLVFVTILANYLLIPQFGINGAAIATALSILIYNIVKFMYVWIKLNLQPFTKATIAVVVPAAISAVIALYFISFDLFLLQFILQNLVFLLLFAGPILYFNVSPDLNQLIRRISTFKKP